MTPSDFDRFSRGLAQCAAGYLVKLTVDQVAAYWAALEAYDLAAVEAALAAAPRISPTFFPKVGELITLIEGSAQDRAAVAWRTLLSLSQSEGAYPSLQVADGGLAFAIDQAGGWIEYQRVLGDASREMERANQKSFEQLYRLGHARSVPGRYFPGAEEMGNYGAPPIMRPGPNGRPVLVYEIPVHVAVVVTERYSVLSMPFDVRTGRLTEAARAALTTGGEALRPYMPAPAPRLLAASIESPDEERATPEQVRQINQAVEALAGGRRLQLGPAPTESDTIQ